MAPYSMDLRKRVARAWDASGDADEVAARFAVSRAWVHRLIQRRRETGSLAPRKQTKFQGRVLAAAWPLICYGATVAGRAGIGSETTRLVVTGGHTRSWSACASRA